MPVSDDRARLGSRGSIAKRDANCVGRQSIGQSAQRGFAGNRPDIMAICRQPDEKSAG
jgi:hypothetical protein